MLKNQLEKDLIGRYSTFTIVEKTLSEVIQLLLHNERLKRLLYYTDPRALNLPKLTQEQSLSLLNTGLRIIPKLDIETDAKPYVIIGLDNFIPNEGQTTFRSCTLSFDIFCRYDDWMLGDFKLRPYSIAGEIDGLINKSFMNGLGIAKFTGAKNIILNSNFGGVSLYYQVETVNDDTKLHLEGLK